MEFKDHFSGHADAYSRARPIYPPELFAWLSELTAAHERAWDCGTGNGQAALRLAEHYQQVLGSDASSAQIARAPKHSKVTWRVSREDDSGLPDKSVDLAIVAQALHWFDAPAYFAEVQRTLKPGGVIAAWSYGLLQVQPAVDAIINRFYWDEVGPFWPEERRMVENGYRDITFPFEPVEAPAFVMRSPLNLAGVVDYIGTWSAVQRFKVANDLDPIPALHAELMVVWGEPTEPRMVEWPVAMRAGRMDE